MELLFVARAGAILGLGARYLLPRRHTHGSALIPVLGVAVACVRWVGLTWSGLKSAGAWLSWVPPVGTAVIAAGVALLAGRARPASDARLLHSLMKGAVAR